MKILSAASAVDAKQLVRLRRFGLAALVYGVGALLVMVAWALEMLPTAKLLEAAAAFAAINLGVYAAIRSGFNLRFKDPSLTRFQILAAITVLMYVIYHMDEGRQVALSACFLIFLFGAFRLAAREFTVLTLYTLAAYSLVIALLMRFRPDALHDARSELMAWLGLAGFLPVFTVIGERINDVRLAMRQSEARFRGLSEMSSDFFWETDAEHRMLQRRSFDLMSRRASMFRQGPMAGERRWEIPYLSPDEAGWRAHRRTLDAHEPFRGFELSRLGADGAERHISISGDPLFDASGRFTGYQGVGTQITERKRAEQALRASAHSLALLADNIPAMTVSLDRDLRCRLANKAFTGFFGLAGADLVGMHLREILGAETYREIEGHFARALQGHTVLYQRLHRRAGGETRHLEIKIIPDQGEHGRVQGCFTMTTDITEYKLAEARMQRVAHHDSLTGLANRLLFDDRLEHAISAAKRDSRQFALLYLDLNLFKPVNDTLGHAAGDELLKAVATRIRRLVRESDTVARIGGDEFTVILLDVAGRAEAEIAAGKIVDALAIAFELGESRKSVQIGISVGIAVYPADGGDARALVEFADAAMYRAKQAANGFPRAA